MRVALDGTPLIGAKTGVGWYTYELVDAMAPRRRGDEFALLPISWRTARVLDAPPHPNVSVVRKFAPAQPLWLAWRLIGRPRLEWFIDCDVFHGTNFVAPPSRKTPVVVTVHDLSFLRYPDAVAPAVQAMGRLLPHVLRRAAGVIVPSEFVADDLARWQPHIADRVTAIHHGFRARPPGAPRSSGDPYVLWLGTITKRKNPELLVGALARLRDRGMRVRAVLAGTSDGTVDVAALIAAAGLGEQVEVLGYVDEAAAASLLSGAQAFVFPSRYEGFGLPLLEAMDAGVPIVAADAGATREIVGDAALFAGPDDVKGFADALHAVLTDAVIRTDLVAKGAARLTEFSWSDAADTTARAYAAVS